MSDKLSEKDEVLYRQIHPTFVQDGVPTSQSFVPTPKDDGKLSVDRSSLTTAESAHSHFVGKGRQSSAVYGVSVNEFGVQTIDCFPDPIDEPEDRNPSHAYANYKPFTSNDQKNKAKRIKQSALLRGRLHPKE